MPRRIQVDPSQKNQALGIEKTFATRFGLIRDMPDAELRKYTYEQLDVIHTALKSCSDAWYSHYIVGPQIRHLKTRVRTALSLAKKTKEVKIGI